VAGRWRGTGSSNTANVDGDRSTAFAAGDDNGATVDGDRSSAEATGTGNEATATGDDVHVVVAP
jgi:hypothetical protein